MRRRDPRFRRRRGDHRARERVESPEHREGRASDAVSGWPTDTYFGKKKEMFFNGEGIEILHMPAAHTDGDSIVFFRRSDVISLGRRVRHD